MSAPIEIPGFTLERLVAKGGFSEVWFGTAPSAKPVAVKVATSEVGARMLRAEAALYERLRVVAGVPTVRAFQDGETPGLVLDWFGDRSYRDVLRGTRRESDRPLALRLLLDIVTIMADVHARGVAHGDLKPENVLVHDAGGLTPDPVILDFGLAREFQRERLGARLSESLKTTAGLEGGTLAYLPPEAVKGAEPSPAGDVYALGVMLHEALLGRRPDKAVSPETLKKLLDPEIVDVLCKALAYAPGDRYADARVLRDALRAHEAALTATGFGARRRAAVRLLLAGLAAFFVVLRYASVAALLAGYAALVVSCFVARSPLPLIGFLPILLLHVAIRWEGPETQQEAALRQQGQVVARKSFVRPPSRDPRPRR